MKPYLFCFLICMTALNSASAAVIELDWKAPGDGLLTYDTVNKREWLDLSQSLLSDQFPGTGSNFREIRESRYQYVLGQTAPGGLFDSFRVARSAQVLALAQSAGIDTSTRSYSVNAVATRELGNLLGFTIQAVNGNKLAIGLIDEVDPNPAVPYLRRRGAEFNVQEGSGTTAGLRLSINHLESSAPPGIMLYRAIPEPNALVAIVSALFCSQLFLRRTI